MTDDSKKMTKRKDLIVIIGVFLIYIIFNMVLLYLHEPWRDEAQVWLLSRDMQIWELPGQMHYEGHPCLWHVIMVPFAKAGMPYFMQSVVAFVISAAAAAVFYFGAPFGLIWKTFILFSPIFTYYYPVVARNYCMIALFLMLLAYVFKKRHEKSGIYCLMIGLLVQTHSVMIFSAFGLGLCLFLEYVFLNIMEKGDLKSLAKRCIPLLIPFASALFWLWQMMHDSESSALLIVRSDSIAGTIQTIYDTAQEAFLNLCGVQGEATFCIFIILIAVFVLMVVTWIQSLRASAEYESLAARGTLIITLGLTCVFQLWFYAMVYSYSMQKLIGLLALCLWGCWIIKDSASSTVKVYSLAFTMIMVLCTINCYGKDIRNDALNPYSNAKEAADFIRNNIEDYTSAVYIADNEAEVTAIFPYIDRIKVLYAPNGDEFTYVTWDERWNERGLYSDLTELVEEQSEAGDKDIYIISCPERSYIEENYLMPGDYESIYKTSIPSIKGEDYEIFKVK